MCACACVWLWIGDEMFASQYVQKANQGTIIRTGSDRVCEDQPVDSEKGRNMPREVRGTDAGGETLVSQRRDLNRPLVSWKGPVAKNFAGYETEREMC